MANRPQNSAKGNFTKKAIHVAASGSIFFDSYAGSTALLSCNSTGLIAVGGLKVSNKYQLTANSTALLFPTVSVLPATRQVGGVAFVSNGTGKSLVFHSTGTTWAYALKTSVLA